MKRLLLLLMTSSFANAEQVRVGRFSASGEIPAPWKVEQLNTGVPPTNYRLREWDNRHPIGTWQPNAYADRARMLVLRSGAANAGRWLTERRDVSADFQNAFGHAPAKITGLALASDTDNTGESAHAGFADFHFVSKDESC